MAKHWWGVAALAAAALGVAACNIHEALFGFPEPAIAVTGPGPVELHYREANGLVILTGRVNDRADVDFILDTGAPVTVFVDGKQTAALGLDTSAARPLGDAKDPATPVGVIERDFRIAFPGLALSGLSAVVIPGKSLPCPERFAAIDFGGVIGADLFRRFVVEVDRVGKRVILHEPKDWRPPEGAAFVPLGFSGGHPYVDAKVLLASGDEVPARLHLDTGMNKSLKLVAGGGSPIPMPATGEVKKACYVSGVREERVGPPVTVQLGAARLPVASPTYTTRENTTDVARSGILGNDAFRARRVFIDYPSRRLGVSSPAA